MATTIGWIVRIIDVVTEGNLVGRGAGTPTQDMPRWLHCSFVKFNVAPYLVPFACPFSKDGHLRDRA